VKFTTKIDMGNAAFADDPNELARLLHNLARFVEGAADSPREGHIYDVNGNRVGEWKISKR
jgi:hypothetical protein